MLISGLHMHTHTDTDIYHICTNTNIYTARDFLNSKEFCGFEEVFAAPEGGTLSSWVLIYKACYNISIDPLIPK